MINIEILEMEIAELQNEIILKVINVNKEFWKLVAECKH